MTEETNPIVSFCQNKINFISCVDQIINEIYLKNPISSQEAITETNDFYPKQQKREIPTDDLLSKNDIKVLLNMNSRAIEKLIRYKIMLRTSRF